MITGTFYTLCPGCGLDWPLDRWLHGLDVVDELLCPRCRQSVSATLLAMKGHTVYEEDYDDDDDDGNVLATSIG